MIASYSLKHSAWTLTPLSWLFRGGVLFRHFLYDKKILAEKCSRLPVISIGNLTTGGTGKTQVALLLAEELEKEFSVSILSRGYRGKAEHFDHPLIVDIKKHSADQCGDEPWLLASRLRATTIIVNKNRYQCALCAEKIGSHLILLDDGMQHRKLHRDFEIIVIDGTRPFDGFLPKGNLREDLSRLKVGDLIFFVGEPDTLLQRKVAKLSAAPQVVAKIEPYGLFDLNDQLVGDLKNPRVGVFCGIGNPHRFVETVKSLGLQVVATHFSSDHKLMSKRQLHQFILKCQKKGATYLLCTEKDKVKIQGSMLSMPILWLKTKLSLISNQHAWSQMLIEIKQKTRLNEPK